MEKISAFNYLLSYLREIPVTIVQSHINPALTVSIYHGKYMLSTGNAIYSFEDNYTSFRVAFENIKPEKRKIQNVLLLGTGLGSIPKILSKHHHINCHYTAVDIDPAVIELAKKYFQVPVNSTLEMVCEDAAEFVKKTKEHFDLIAVDLFIGDVTPEKFDQPEFLEGLKGILSPEGLIVFSRMAYSPKQKEMADDFYDKVFKKIFPDSDFINTGSNLMLVGEFGR